MQDFKKYAEDNFYKDGKYKRNVISSPKHAIYFEELKRHLGLKEISNAETLYRLMNPESTNECKECKSKTVFVNIFDGFRDFCSNSCRAKNAELNATRAKNTQTTLMKRYGADNTMRISKFKNKAQQTNLKKYGATNFVQSEVFKEMSKRTSMARYGVEYPAQSNEIQQKIFATIKNKYGRSCVRDYTDERHFRIEVFKECLQDRQITTSDPLENLIEIPLSDVALNLQHSCGVEWLHKNLNIRPKCPVCHKQSSLEISFCEWVKSLNIPFTVNDRKIIKPFELDVVFPNHKIAVELNGIYWHAESENQTKVSVLDKTVKCLNEGYMLISIWEHEWNDLHKREKIKNVIKSKLGINQKLFARKLKVGIPDKKEVFDFLNKYHLQSSIGYKFASAIFDNDGNILSVMTFGKSRFSKRHNYEVLRLCTKGGVTIVGGAQKMFKFAMINFFQQGDKILTYADRRFGDGAIYTKLGMVPFGYSSPNYVWWRHKTFLPRGATMKKNLPNILGDKFNPALTEDENMYSAGYRKLCDAGNARFEYCV